MFAIFVVLLKVSMSRLPCGRLCGEPLCVSSTSVDAVEARPRLRRGKIPLRAMKNLTIDRSETKKNFFSIFEMFIFFEIIKVIQMTKRCTFLSIQDVELTLSSIWEFETCR